MPTHIPRTAFVLVIHLLLAAIEKLIKIDKVDALVIGFSISGQIVRPYATAARIPLFCICSVGGVGDELYTFTMMPLAEDEATRWVAEAKRRNIKRIVLPTQDYPSINNHVRVLKAEAAKAEIAFVSENKFEAATTDFKSRIASVHGQLRQPSIQGSARAEVSRRQARHAHDAVRVRLIQNAGPSLRERGKRRFLCPTDDRIQRYGGQDHQAGRDRQLPIRAGRLGDQER